MSGIPIHLEGMLRNTGALTVPIIQNFVFGDFNGAMKLVAVAGDFTISPQGLGALISVMQNFVTINGIPIIVQGDSSNPDIQCSPFQPLHCLPIPTQFSDFINIIL